MVQNEAMLTGEWKRSSGKSLVALGIHDMTCGAAGHDM